MGDGPQSAKRAQEAAQPSLPNAEHGYTTKPVETDKDKLLPAQKIKMSPHLARNKNYRLAFLT